MFWTIQMSTKKFRISSFRSVLCDREPQMYKKCGEQSPLLFYLHHLRIWREILAVGCLITIVSIKSSCLFCRGQILRINFLIILIRRGAVFPYIGRVGPWQPRRSILRTHGCRGSGRKSWWGRSRHWGVHHVAMAWGIGWWGEVGIGWWGKVGIGTTRGHRCHMRLQVDRRGWTNVGRRWGCRHLGYSCFEITNLILKKKSD